MIPHICDVGCHDAACCACGPCDSSLLLVASGFGVGGQALLLSLEHVRRYDRFACGEGGAGGEASCGLVMKNRLVV